MLNEQLKESTHPSHQALEKKMVSMIRKIRTRNDYVTFLKLMYGYYSALEKRVQEYVSDLEIGKRRKAERLLEDISYFEATASPDVCKELPPITSHAEALGAMYVMEGSTMGGEIIARMIEGQAGINGPSGFSFFNGYGDDTGRMWEEFKVFLNRPFDEMEKLNLILTANRTFITFYNWIDKHAATS
jgi:heme oxygenase